MPCWMARLQRSRFSENERIESLMRPAMSRGPMKGVPQHMIHVRRRFFFDFPLTCIVVFYSFDLLGWFCCVPPCYQKEKALAKPHRISGVENSTADSPKNLAVQGFSSSTLPAGN